LKRLHGVLLRLELGEELGQSPCYCTRVVFHRDVAGWSEAPISSSTGCQTLLQ
jgi:hypothetical protein